MELLVGEFVAPKALGKKHMRAEAIILVGEHGTSLWTLLGAETWGGCYHSVPCWKARLKVVDCALAWVPWAQSTFKTFLQTPRNPGLGTQDTLQEAEPVASELRGHLWAAIPVALMHFYQ